MGNIAVKKGTEIIFQYQANKHLHQSKTMTGRIIKKQKVKHGLYRAIADAYILSSPQIIIRFIAKNFSPDEVFSKTELRHFYEDHKSQLENKLPVNY
jgi:hypothetical protein